MRHLVPGCRRAETGGSNIFACSTSRAAFAAAAFTLSSLLTAFPDFARAS